MRSISLDRVHDAFLHEIKVVEKRFSRVCDAVGHKGYRRVHSWIAEMSLVSAVTHWERYLSSLLVAHISNAPGRFLAELGLPADTKVTRALIEAVLTGVSYLDADDVRRLSNKFSEAKFLKKIRSQVEKCIADVVLIRNHIVHDSRDSRRKYEGVLKGEADGSDWGRIPVPGTYLTAKSEGKCRLLHYLAWFRRAVTTLRK